MSSLAERVRAVPAPEPVLDRGREAKLTGRQRQILDELSRLFEKGFLDVTMADLAAQLNCSLRTLYNLAESRNELVLMVSDRNLRKIGRAAHAAIRDETSALDAVRLYLGAATIAVSDVTPEFNNDMAQVTGGPAMQAAHSEYLIDVTRTLLDMAIENREIGPVDTAAVARMIAGVGREFSRTEVMADLSSSPKDAADAMVEIVLAGLERPT